MAEPLRQRLDVALLPVRRFDIGARWGPDARLTTKYQLDVVVIVIVIVDDVVTVGQVAALGVTGDHPRREADQEQRSNDPEQRNERRQQHRLRHRGRERLAHELGQLQGDGAIPAASNELGAAASRH